MIAGVALGLALAAAVLHAHGALTGVAIEPQPLVSLVGTLGIIALAIHAWRQPPDREG